MTQEDNPDLKKFTQLVAAYGARPSVWPKAQRDWAQALLATSPAARRIAADAAEVDRWLDSQVAPPPATDLEARVLASAPAVAGGRHAPAASLHRRSPLGLVRRWRDRLTAQPLWRPARRPLYAAACAALFGLLLGWGGFFSDAVPAGEEEEILARAFVGGGLESYDLGELQ